MTARPIVPLIAILTLLLAGCGGTEPTPDSDGLADAVPRSASAPGATVFIIEPIDGATVSSPITVKFGISGMAVVPAGLFPDNSGHHHLLVDAGLDSEVEPIPSDVGHRHFGKGQTETTIELGPGQHTLQLVLGDGSHIPHEPPVISNIITITVE